MSAKIIFPGDLDLNIFFSDQAAITSTFGIPKKMGEYDGLEVKLMRNKVPEETTIIQYAYAQSSNRWKRS